MKGGVGEGTIVLEREKKPKCALRILKKETSPSKSLYLRVQGHKGVVFCPVNWIGKGQIRPVCWEK